MNIDDISDDDIVRHFEKGESANLIADRLGVWAPHVVDRLITLGYRLTPPKVAPYLTTPEGAADLADYIASKRPGITYGEWLDGGREGTMIRNRRSHDWVDYGRRWRAVIPEHRPAQKDNWPNYQPKPKYA